MLFSSVITALDVDTYRLAKVQQSGLGNTSINKTLTTLAAILESAVEYELISRNVAKGRRRRLSSATPRRTWLGRADHISALLDAAGALDQGARIRGQRKALIATLVFAGLRLGELLSLCWGDVDVVRATLRVGQAKTDAGARTVNMLPILREEILRHESHTSRLSHELVFGSSTGKPLSPTNVRKRIIEPAVVRASGALEERDLAPLPQGVTPHSLRRTFASLLFALGESPVYVMGQMGHTTAGLTLAIYAREMSRRDGEAPRLRTLVEGTTKPDPSSAFGNR